MKIAIMQPYIFPYIGYFQLINAVDKFIFYDDVNYIKRGWINRNQLLINGEAQLFTIPVLKASQNKLINEIELGIDEKWLNQFLLTLEYNYKKAPYFEETFSFLQNVFYSDFSTIADLAMRSTENIAHYLEISTIFEKSSEKYALTKGMDKADRLIEICHQNNATTYINPTGGKGLYSKEYFKNQHIDLFFIENKIIPYTQYKNNFIGGLSIIDVLMFNNKKEILNQVNSYQLI